MAISIRSEQSAKEINHELLQKVLLDNDVSRLTKEEKTEFLLRVCESLHLNPLTRPIQIHKFQNGKESPYVSKDGGEQLRNNHEVSIVKIETELLKNDLYVVKAHATKPSGRQDCSTSAQNLAGLKGDALCNAMKKCETQAKRRVTLSICGLGMLDETELENLPREAKVMEPKVIDISGDEIIKETDDSILDTALNLSILPYIQAVENCKNVDELKDVYYDTIRNKSLKGNPKAMKLFIEAKDKKRNELENQKFLQEYNGTETKTDEVQDEKFDAEC